MLIYVINEGDTKIHNEDYRKVGVFGCCENYYVKLSFFNEVFEKLVECITVSELPVVSLLNEVPRRVLTQPE